ncbi:ClpX2 [Desulfamplus magnetovallimortis]|uniref:ClpX2 n=1 Tax=Desulfamplus magnetovallimortis TaxID=1246637 RepID=A0A1W1H4M0_9BACT|nr:AAA family ATPase [Desulfamplus magnetovallimortis]SLM27421.1 ClpX2 [Desulfamplus magnetovallimortis]
MKEKNENIPDPSKIEKELGEFLNKKFGGNVKIITPSILPKQTSIKGKDVIEDKKKFVNFDIKPSELISYLDQYIVRQNKAKSVLATKICTHFNKIKYTESLTNTSHPPITGNIKSNILMLGPTGVGKTYIIKLIAKRIGVPFVKADATKFSETGYVGGDVEDIIRDLVREADDDISIAEYGIVYIDEIDKIAASQNFRGADVSRTGVQRALLKPMEETDVELKVPHDPISMMQELESYQKTGKRNRKRVNTANILFIVSGAFGDLAKIVSKRVTKQSIGFASTLSSSLQESQLLQQMKSEDLVEFGFESEFIGRLPVRCILDPLSKQDLYDILRMPNNPVVLGKRLDFKSYGIDIVFTDDALELLAEKASQENTGARGLVSAVENTLISFEEKLPSSSINILTVTKELVAKPEKHLEKILCEEQQANKDSEEGKLALENRKAIHAKALENEKTYIISYITDNWKNLSHRHGLTLSDYRCGLVADYFSTHVTELGNAIRQVKSYYESIKKIEVDFYKNYDLNIVMEEDAVDFLIEEMIHNPITSEDVMEKIYNDFYDGLNLVRDKSGKNRFFISRDALLEHKKFLDDLIRKKLS